MKYIVVILLLVSIQTDWIEEIRLSIKRIDEFSTLKQEFEINDKDGKVVFKQFTLKNEKKTRIEYKYGQLMNFQRSFYENEKIIFAKIEKGKTSLVYKRKRKDDEPYAMLMEKVTYFKNEKEGIRKIRKIKIFENSNIEKLKKELDKKEYETEIVGEKEYKAMKEQFERINESVN